MAITLKFMYVTILSLLLCLVVTKAGDYGQGKAFLLIIYSLSYTIHFFISITLIYFSFTSQYFEKHAYPMRNVQMLQHTVLHLTVWGAGGTYVIASNN